MQDQEMIQAFSPHAQEKAFTDGIRSKSPVGVLSTLIPLVVAMRAKLCGMIVQESGPVLSTRSVEANWFHILLNGSFAYERFSSFVE